MYSLKHIMGPLVNHWAITAIGIAVAIATASLNVYTLVVQLLPGGGGLWGGA